MEPHMRVTASWSTILILLASPLEQHQQQASRDHRRQQASSIISRTGISLSRLQRHSRTAAIMSRARSIARGRARTTDSDQQRIAIKKGGRPEGPPSGQKQMNKAEAIRDMRSQIGQRELEQTLSYYNIRVANKRLLCPFPEHNDRHLGNCVLGDRGYIRCFSCGRSANAVDLVMLYEHMDYVPAVEFLWTRILGRTLPEYDRPERRNVTISVQDLELIGIASPSARYVKCYINCTNDKHEQLPNGYFADHDALENIGIYRQERADGFYDLLETDPVTAREIAAGKCRETTEHLQAILQTVDGTDREYCLQQLKKCDCIKKKIGAIQKRREGQR